MKRCPHSPDDQEGVINYCNYLEGQEDRLRSMEAALNKVENSTIANKAEFLAFFKEFKT